MSWIKGKRDAHDTHSTHCFTYSSCNFGLANFGHDQTTIKRKVNGFWVIGGHLSLDFSPAMN